MNTTPALGTEPEYVSHPTTVANAVRLPLAIVAGALGALVGALIWGTVVYVTHYQIGYIAVLVGVIVGAAVRASAGRSVPHAVVSGVCSLAGCALGNVLMVVVLIARVEDMSLLDMALRLSPGVVAEMFASTFEIPDLVFYAIAAIIGFKFVYPATEH